jgi:hypothetical protein
MAYPDRGRLGTSAAGAGVPGLLSRVVGLVAGAIVLSAALLVSAVLAVVALVVAAAVGAYLWWRTRELRRGLREAGIGAGTANRPFDRTDAGSVRDGVVIEGDFIREVPERDPRSHG